MRVRRGKYRGFAGEVGPAGQERQAQAHEGEVVQRARPMPKTLRDHLMVFERVILIQTLERNGFSRNLAAQVLGITRGHLWRRMRKLNIDFSVLPRTTISNGFRKKGHG